MCAFSLENRAQEQKRSEIRYVGFVANIKLYIHLARSVYRTANDQIDTTEAIVGALYLLPDFSDIRLTWLD